MNKDWAGVLYHLMVTFVFFRVLINISNEKNYNFFGPIKWVNVIFNIVLALFALVSISFILEDFNIHLLSNDEE